MEEVEWIPLEINYSKNRLRIALAKSRVSIHPLLPTISKKIINKRNEPLSAVMGCIERENLQSEKSPDPLRFDPLSLPKSSRASGGDDKAMNETPCINQPFHSSHRTFRHMPHKSAEKTSWQICKEKIVNDYAVILDTTMTVGDSNSNNYNFYETEEGHSSNIVTFQNKYEQRLACLEKKSGSNSKSVKSSVRRIEVCSFCKHTFFRTSTS